MLRRRSRFERFLYVVWPFWASWGPLVATAGSASEIWSERTPGWARGPTSDPQIQISNVLNLQVQNPESARHLALGHLAERGLPSAGHLAWRTFPIPT